MSLSHLHTNWKYESYVDDRDHDTRKSENPTLFNSPSGTDNFLVPKLQLGNAYQSTLRVRELSALFRATFSIPVTIFVPSYKQK